MSNYSILPTNQYVTGWVYANSIFDIETNNIFTIITILLKYSNMWLASYPSGLWEVYVRESFTRIFEFWHALLDSFTDN